MEIWLVLSSRALKRAVGTQMVWSVQMTCSLKQLLGVLKALGKYRGCLVFRVII